MLARYGADVARVDAPWGRAVDPADVAREVARSRVDLVAVVHGETSTGVCNPIRDIVAIAHGAGALVVVDGVTSLGAVPLDVAAWDIDACFSCSQKGLGAPSGLSPITVSPRALARRVGCRSVSLDLALLEDYWLRRKYHHTISAPLVFALSAALEEVETEGLAARWARHREVHAAFVAALAELGLELLPAPADRLASLTAVRVPAGVDDAALRRRLLDRFGIEIGGGLGPLAGQVVRVGLMGTGATLDNVARLTEALTDALAVAPR
jgi:alanine-glyoxylate transaminase/serine-glyoxylate transaminase/serine-pyruvate transaminase